MADAKTVCNNPSVSGKHPGTCEKVDNMQSSPKTSKWYTADVVEKYHNWLNKQPTAPIAGAPSVSKFQEETGAGSRAIKKLQEQEGGGTPVIGAYHHQDSVGYELPLEEDPEFRQDYQDEYGNSGHYEVPKAHRPEHRLNKRKKALTAEPDYIWSKNPNTVHAEYRNRLGSGTHPDDVFKQILGEIADHYASGQISNRDAHRAANEAFGRYVMTAKKTGTRKQSWSGWGPSQKPKRHKVSGWQWDEYQNGYISSKPRLFQCSCGEPVRVPDYHNCKCGKVWNTYVIGTGGDRHEASAEKYIAREIPARKDVIVAKRIATDHFHDEQNRYTGPMKMNAPPDPYQGSDFCPGCGNHFAKGHDAECPHLTKWGKTNLHSPQQTHYRDYDKALNDWEHQEESETAFPTKHLPKVNSDTKGTNAKDWYRRDHATQRWTA